MGNSCPIKYLYTNENKCNCSLFVFYTYEEYYIYIYDWRLDVFTVYFSNRKKRCECKFRHDGFHHMIISPLIRTVKNITQPEHNFGCVPYLLTYLFGTITTNIWLMPVQGDLSMTACRMERQTERKTSRHTERML
jgi:hypothetical protein